MKRSEQEIRDEEIARHKYVEKVGEIMAYSPEQAAHLVSMQNGDDGKRDIQYKGYSVRYEAIEV